MIIFLILMLVYIALCIGGFKGYFYLQNINDRQKSNRFLKVCYSYVLFAIFICLEIPFALFFPAWLSEKLIEGASESTIYFLLFGCFVLGMSIWKGRSYRPKNF